MDDFTCGLCLKILVYPSTLTCGHTFCRSCIKKSYSNFKQCPICRVSILLPKNIPVTYILQSYLEKSFPETMDKRKEEVKQDEVTFDFQFIPVMILDNFLLFPGSSTTLRLFEPRYMSMLENVLQDDKVFGIISRFNNTWIGCAIEVVSSIQKDGVYFVNVTSKKRLRARAIYPSSNSAIEIFVEQIGVQHFQDQMLYMAKKEYIEDIDEDRNIQLQEKLIKFTDECVSRLARNDHAIVGRVLNRNADLSFFMMSVLKLDIGVLTKGFLSVSYNERLELVNLVIRDKRPSRDWVLINSSGLSNKYGPFFIVACLIILYLFR